VSRKSTVSRPFTTGTNREICHQKNRHAPREEAEGSGKLGDERGVMGGMWGRGEDLGVGRQKEVRGVCWGVHPASVRSYKEKKVRVPCQKTQILSVHVTEKVAKMQRRAEKTV